MISELALAVVLLTGAGLLLKSFLRLQQVDPGFQAARLVTFRVSLPESRYPEPARRLQFFQRALESVRRIPGVDSAAIVDRVPVAGGGSGAWLNISGRPLPAQQTPPVVRYQVVSPEYFDTMGIRLVRGRLLTGDDRADHAPSVVISRSLARRFWPSQDPIGRTVVLGPLEGPFPPTAVVGIVEDVKLEGLDAETPAIVYLPHAVMPLFSNFDFVVRTVGDSHGRRTGGDPPDTGTGPRPAGVQRQLAAGNRTGLGCTDALLDAAADPVCRRCGGACLDRRVRSRVVRRESARPRDRYPRRTWGGSGAPSGAWSSARACDRPFPAWSSASSARLPSRGP